MSREVCKHGVEINRNETSSWFPCNDCVAESQFNAAFPGVKQKEVERKERRAEWIRNNVAQLVCFNIDDPMSVAVDDAEYLADVLEKRGYL